MRFQSILYVWKANAHVDPAFDTYSGQRYAGSTIQRQHSPEGPVEGRDGKKTSHDSEQSRAKARLSKVSIFHPLAPQKLRENISDV